MFHNLTPWGDYKFMNFLLLLVITVLIPWLHPSPCFYKRRRQWAHWHKFMRTRKMIQRSMAKDWAKQKYECLLPNWYFKTLLIHRISNCTTVNQTLLIHRISNCTTANHQTIGPNSFFPVREITEIGSSLSLSLSLSHTHTHTHKHELGNLSCLRNQKEKRLD